jgi:16S rRNA (guanine527-N7)-methyltransferase
MGGNSASDAGVAAEVATLVAGARTLGVPLQDSGAQRLLQLLAELTRWNRTYNLTAVSVRSEMLTHHLLDSLAVAPYLAGPRIADVGTGAGFPGLPLALVRPDLHFVLIDSAGKKLRFVAHAARTLDLPNVELLQARVENLQPAAPFNTVVARAFAPLPRLFEQIGRLCGPDTRVLAMKGRRPDSEINEVRPPWRVIETVGLAIPGLNEARHLVIADCRLAP